MAGVARAALRHRSGPRAGFGPVMHQSSAALHIARDQGGTRQHAHGPDILPQPAKGFMLPPRRAESENAEDGPEDPGLPLVLQAVRSDAGAGPSDMNRKGNRPLAAQGSEKRVQHSPDGPQKPADPGHMRRIRHRYSCRGPGHSPMSCMPFCPPKARAVAATRRCQFPGNVLPAPGKCACGRPADLRRAPELAAPYAICSATKIPHRPARAPGLVSPFIIQDAPPLSERPMHLWSGMPGFPDPR